MKLYIFRHGQTDMNTQHRMQGRINTRLNDCGRQQAVLAHNELAKLGIKPDVVYVSPLDRAQETAEIVLGMPRDHFITEERMVEMSFGEAEGKQAHELEDGGFYEMFFHNVVDYQPLPGGETYDELFHRVAEFVEDIRCRYVWGEDQETLQTRPTVHGGPVPEDPTVVIVSHGAAIHALLAYVTHAVRKDFWKISVNNVEVVKVNLSEDKTCVDLIGSDYDDSIESVFPGFGKKWGFEDEEK